MGIETLRVQKNVNAYIVFGSLSNVSDRLDWHKELAMFLKEKIEANIPVLALCFGHQLMADAYGGQIDKVDNELDGEQGVRTINFSQNELCLNSNLEIFVSHHYEVSSIPACFQSFATSPSCKYEALMHRDHPYFSFQGHPEASENFVKDIINKDLNASEMHNGLKGGQKILTQFFALVDNLHT